MYISINQSIIQSITPSLYSIKLYIFIDHQIVRQIPHSQNEQNKSFDFIFFMCPHLFCGSSFFVGVYSIDIVHCVIDICLVIEFGTQSKTDCGVGNMMF